MKLLEKYSKKVQNNGKEGYGRTDQSLILNKIIKSIDVLTEDTLLLNYIAGSTSNEVKAVKSSINEINEGNAELVESVGCVQEAATAIDRRIEDNASHIAQLLSVAREMTEHNSRVKAIFDELMEDNLRTAQGINAVAENTKLSNEAAAEILQTAEMINTLTYKTNLLGLNASIEAARAGEVGKGFAIVAKEIQELAQKSKESAETIGRIMERISFQAGQSIKGIENMQDTFDNQTQNLKITKKLLDITGTKINQVYEQVGLVESNMGELEESKNTILSNMEGLVKLADNNRQVTDLISSDFKEIEENSAEITTIAFQLSNINNELRYAARELKQDGAAQAGESIHLRVGYMPNYGSLCSVVAAMKMGYLEQENVTVELQEFENGSLIIDALREGKLDVGYIGHGAHKRCIKGDAVIFLLSHISNAEAVIGSRKKGARTLEALKGMRIGTVEGTTSDTILNYSLANAGYTREDCTIISKKPKELITDMLAGSLDACALWSPWTLELQRRLGNDAVLLAHNADFFHRLASLSSWVTAPAYAEANKEKLLRFTRALYRGMNYRVMEKNIKQVASWVSEIAKIDEKSAYEQRADAEWATAGFVSIGAANGKVKELYEAQQQQFLKDGDITGTVPVEKYVLFNNMIAAAR